MGTPRDRHGHRRLTAFTLRLLGEIGGIIAAPVVLLTWLARRANVLLEIEEVAKPKVMAVSLLLAFIVSTVALCIRAADYGEQYEVLTDKPVDVHPPDGGGGRDGPPSDRSYG